jgi:radical SAM family RiPP maturation amino acid epimerase
MVVALDIRPVFERPDLADGEYLAQLGLTKRFLELWYLDGAFRDRLNGDAGAAVRDAMMAVDPEELRPLWDREHRARLSRLKAEGSAFPPLPLPVLRYKSFIEEKLAFRDRIRSEAAPQDEVMRAWRGRQMCRCVSELGAAKALGLVHAPVAFELNKGCSVGCWFCGVGAEKLTEQADYSQIGGLWRETLFACREVMGESAKWGFCYWATEPLDNPNYEEFCVDFADILGRFPQTTTAVPLRDPARTRDLLGLSMARGAALNRFSILSLGVLRRVFEEFRPEELLCVELLPLNKESGEPKAKAGSARSNAERYAKAGHVLPQEEHSSTIACISGFLFNMVERRVRLLTPCNASDRWSNGYWVLEDATFRDGEDARRIMGGMIERQMGRYLDRDRPLAFRRDLCWHAELGEAHSRWFKHRIPSGARLGDLLSAGAKTATEIVMDLGEDERSMAEWFYLLQSMYEAGLLDEEPRASLTPSAIDASHPGLAQ